MFAFTLGGLKGMRNRVQILPPDGCFAFCPSQPLLHQYTWAWQPAWFQKCTLGRPQWISVYGLTALRRPGPCQSAIAYGRCFVILTVPRVFCTHMCD